MQLPESSPAGSYPAARPAESTAASGGSSRELAARFESVLLREILAPLSHSLGFYGDAVAGEAALAIARGERGGLADALERAIADRDP